MDFKKTFEQSSEKIKLDFLNAIIINNKEMQTAFMNFASAGDHYQTEPDYKYFLEIVRDTAEMYHDKFEFVDPDNPDWDNYISPHEGYIPDYEAAQYATEQEFRRIFEDFEIEAVYTIIEQKVETLTAMIIGLYEARKDVEVNDEYDSFPELDEFLLQEHQIILGQIIKKLRLAALSQDTIITTTALFFKYCGEKYSGHSFFMSHFEEYLMTVAEKSNNPEEILTQLDQSGIKRKSMPRLVLLLNQMTGNSTEWLGSARQYYQYSKDVARQLLEYFFNNSKPDFLVLARELFDKDKNHWAQALRDFVTPELDKPLFVDVFCQLTINQKQIEDYHKLQAHLPPERLENLLVKIDWDKSFKVQILAAEQRYDEIRTIVEQNPNDWSYPELIKPILEIFPAFCFDQIKRKAHRTLANERGRSVYQRIVELLLLADTIPGHKAENRILARELYNHKPNLPAMRDELRRGGLV